MKLLKSLYAWGRGAGLLLAATVTAFADPTDLTAAAQTATTSFTSVLKIGLTAVTLVIVIVGLSWTGWKFAHKDENAMTFLLGTVAASVVLGIAAALV